MSSYKATIRVISEDKLLSKHLEPSEFDFALRPRQQQSTLNIAGISFPIDDEETVEKLEHSVRNNWLVRQAYINLLRSQMPRKTDAHRIYDIVSNKIFTYQALQNYYLTVDRQPYFKQASRKAMVNYDIFQGCMLAKLQRELAKLKNSLVVLERSVPSFDVRRQHVLRNRIKEMCQEQQQTPPRRVDDSESEYGYDGDLKIEFCEIEPTAMAVENKPSSVTGFNFPIADEDTVELLEATVNENQHVRDEYICYLRKKKPKSAAIIAIFQTLFLDEAMYSYNFSGICHRGPSRKAMQNYTIFVDCMLEAWKDHGVDEKILKESLSLVIKNLNGRKRNRKYFAKRREKGASLGRSSATGNLMEPTIKIEEDSVEFDEYAFYSEHNVKTDESSSNDKAPVTTRRAKRSATKLAIADLFQISNACSTHSRNLLKQPFPVHTVNELNELDTLLLGNPNFMEKCAQMLHNAVRNETLENVTGHMRLLLEFAVDYTVLLKYSWFGFLPRSPIARGNGEQQPFRNLIGVIHLLHRARRLRFGKCSLEEIHEGIEKFLKRKLRCHALFVKKQNYVVQGKRRRKFSKLHAGPVPKPKERAGPQKREPYVLLLPEGKIVGVRTGRVESVDKYQNPYTSVFNIEHILVDQDLNENRNGPEILKYLKNGSKLTDPENNEMIRICCEHLQRCDGSMYPDTDKKEILAKSIVHTFPQLASENYPEEPHAIYFHRKLEHVGDDRHSGKITNRFDTIIRKANGKNRYKKPGHVILS